MKNGNRLSEAVLTALAQNAAGDPLGLARVAALAAQQGFHELAYRVALEARDLAPADPLVHELSDPGVAGAVPPWHFRIIRDEVRNSAYDAALRRAVGPECRVLDVGAGTGLLAMMAARAGAAAVIGCEMNAAVADAAAEVVKANGLASRVSIVSKGSQELSAAADLGGPVDVIVSEIVSNDMLREGVLPVMEDAVPRLLKPGGRVIPAAGSIRIALSLWEGFGTRRAGSAAGFDLGAFDRLMRSPLRVGSDEPGLALRSACADLFCFDFSSAGPFRGERAETCLTATGEANGVVQWIRLILDEHTTYENRPGCGFHSCWACLFHPLPQAVGAGDQVRVSGEHDRVSLRLRVQP